jgi:hypothetical protein
VIDEDQHKCETHNASDHPADDGGCFVCRARGRCASLTWGTLLPGRSRNNIRFATEAEEKRLRMRTDEEAVVVRVPVLSAANDVDITDSKDSDDTDGRTEREETEAMDWDDTISTDIDDATDAL